MGFDGDLKIIFSKQEIVFYNNSKDKLKKNGKIKSLQLKSGSLNCGISGWAKLASISSCGRL